MKKNLFKRIVSVCSAAVMMCSIGITADLPEVKAYAADVYSDTLPDAFDMVMLRKMLLEK